MINRLTVISLDRTAERLAQFRHRNPGFAFERFSAIDAASLSRGAFVRDGLITADNFYQPGAIGNAMSHVTLWRRCAAGGEALHIIEDDVVLRGDFQHSAAAALQALERYDIVLWTHNLDWPVMVAPAPGTGPLVMQYDQTEAVRGLERFRAGTVPPALMPLCSAAGIACYSVSPRGAARLLADCLPIGAEPAKYVTRPATGWGNSALDVEMSRHYASWQAYVAVPPLAVTPNDQASSTVRGHLAAMHDPQQANQAAIPAVARLD